MRLNGKYGALTHMRWSLIFYDFSMEDNMRKVLLWLFITVITLTLSVSIMAGDDDKGESEIPELTEQRAEELVRAADKLLRVFSPQLIII